MCSTVEGDGIVDGPGNPVWAAAIDDRQELAINVRMISRKITKHHQAAKGLGKGVLQDVFHRISR